MKDHKILYFVNDVLEKMPKDWLQLTTHRLDIYNEEKAKTEFVKTLEHFLANGNAKAEDLKAMPTAYDYIRLGHPLSCVLEWSISQMNGIGAENVIAFSSQTMPVMAILRKNLMDKTKTRIVYKSAPPNFFDLDKTKNIYGYNFELLQVENTKQVKEFDGITIYVGDDLDLTLLDVSKSIDFYVHLAQGLGSVIVAISDRSQNYISEIQHVRRRESIAMTPADTYTILKQMIAGEDIGTAPNGARAANLKKVVSCLQEITNTQSSALVASSGLSIQYAIMMGLIDYAKQAYPGKEIRFMVPPNCYGGTNDQARRVAAAVKGVEVMDLPVDSGNDMVKSTNAVLNKVAEMDAVPFIIAEIPTNPRVEVPDLDELNEVLSKERKTSDGKESIAPVFILDQTFCPNFNFLGAGAPLSNVMAISYASGSKFPSGGRCTAGYCVANEKAEKLMTEIDTHLRLCDNEATDLQMQILAEQLPSMEERIKDAYDNTRSFVSYIGEVLPTAKINFVSEDLAAQGFTPSVFSLDLPTKGTNDAEREEYKRVLNHRLIHMMITQIPDESKYCVSYGQLKGCYWTIPATSTQGTTKEGDKDYIARVALSGNMDLVKHKQVFKEFVKSLV